MFFYLVLSTFRNTIFGIGECPYQQQAVFSRLEPQRGLTTSWGKQVAYSEANYALSPTDSLIMNDYIFESMANLCREHLPVRGAHPKGAGAHGYFEVTHDVSHITNVKLFNKIGKTTPIFMRFSAGTGDLGSPELRERGKGSGIKFYTEEGNLDLTGLLQSTFLVKDPAYASSFTHSIAVNPKTGLRDSNMASDYVANLPYGLLSSLFSLTLAGQPRSYATMANHAIHTYQVENSRGDINFIRINWYPEGGVQNLTKEEVSELIGSSPDYYTQELYGRIAAGNYPIYSLLFQVIPLADIEKIPFDIFDTTLYWPKDQFPMNPVGRIVLNRNPENYHAEVEMSAFNPGNLLPGIQGVDKLFETRVFIYKQNHLNRLGTGFNNIEVNRPRNRVSNYLRDGVPPVDKNGGSEAHYYPNSLNGPAPHNFTVTPRYKPNVSPETTNLWQVKKFVEDLSPADREFFYDNVATSLANLMPLVRKKVMKIWNDVDKDIAAILQAAIDAKLA